MWIFTVDGFYSVVAFDPTLDGSGLTGKPGDVLVRARVREDLEALKKHVPGLRIWRDDSADYLFRTVLSRDEWTRCLVAEAANIDYENFKNRVTQKLGHERSDIYLRVWRDLLSLQTSLNVDPTDRRGRLGA